MSQTNGVSNARKLTEAAVMLAAGIVLSMIKMLDLPYGGSVTLASMFPIILIAYRHGIRFGLLTGAVYGIIQQLLGLRTLSYVTTWQSVVAVILLDYFIAFMVLGFGGIFRRLLPQKDALLAGTLAVCTLRYLCHVISGATVWAGLSIPTNAALFYSIGYNATYMIPETIVTAVVATCLGSMLDFGNDTITRLAASEQKGIPVLKWTGALQLSAILIFDVRTVFMHLQNAETGAFDATGFAAVNWWLIGIATAVSVVIAVLLFKIPTGTGESA